MNRSVGSSIVVPLNLLLGTCRLRMHLSGLYEFFVLRAGSSRFGVRICRQFQPSPPRPFPPATLSGQHSSITAQRGAWALGLCLTPQDWFHMPISPWPHQKATDFVGRGVLRTDPFKQVTLGNKSVEGSLIGRCSTKECFTRFTSALEHVSRISDTKPSSHNTHGGRDSYVRADGSSMSESIIDVGDVG